MSFSLGGFPQPFLGFWTIEFLNIAYISEMSASFSEVPFALTRPGKLN